MYPKHLRSGSPKPQASTASSAAPESSQIDQSTVIDTSFGVKLRFGLDITSPAASRMLDGRSHRYPVTHPKVEHSTNEHSLTLLSSFSQDLAPSPELTALAVAPLAPPAFHDISQTQCRSCPIVIAPNNFGREPDLQATPMRRPRTRSPSVWALAPRSWRLLRAKGDRPMVTLTVPSPPGAPLPLPHIHEQHLNPEPMSPENDTQQSPPPDQHRRQYSNVDGDDLESDDEDDSWIPRQRVEQYSVSHDIAQTICSAAIEGEFIQDEIILRPHIETPLHWKEQRDEPLAGPSVRRRRSPDTLELRTTSSYDRVNELIRALNTSEDLTDIALEPRPLRYRRVLHEFINPGFEAFQYRGGVGFLNPLDTAVDMIAEGRDHVKGPSDADHDIVDISDSESSQFESDEEVEPEREKSMVSPTDDQVRMGERSRDRTNTGNSWRSLATSEEYPQLPHLPLPQTVASRDLPPSPASVSAAQIHEAGPNSSIGYSAEGSPHVRRPRWQRFRRVLATATPQTQDGRQWTYSLLHHDNRTPVQAVHAPPFASGSTRQVPADERGVGYASPQHHAVWQRSQLPTHLHELHHRDPKQRTRDPEHDMTLAQTQDCNVDATRSAKAGPLARSPNAPRATQHALRAGSSNSPGAGSKLHGDLSPSQGRPTKRKKTSWAALTSDFCEPEARATAPWRGTSRPSLPAAQLRIPFPESAPSTRPTRRPRDEFERGLLDGTTTRQRLHPAKKRCKGESSQ